MEIKLFWAIVSSILTVVVFVPYLIDIYKKKTQPHIYSWLIWTILQSIGAVAIFKGGAGYGAWSLAIGALFCFIIFALSFKFGTKNIKRIDLYCLIGAVITIAVYLFVRYPLYSVILVVCIDFIAFLPTFRKSFEEPYSETMITFFLSALANLITIFALQHYSVTTVLYEATLFMTNGALCIVLVARRRLLNKK